MNVKFFTLVAAAVAGTVSFAASAGSGSGSMADKPTGLRFLNNRLTVKPYVSLSYTYDSNVDSSRHSSDDQIFCISPGADIQWRGDRWQLSGSVWYRYHTYMEYQDSLEESSYGESLSYSWSNVSEEGKGWNLVIGQRYQIVSQSDSFGTAEGRGIFRDRENVNFNGAVERRFANKWHASLTGQYHWLDYLNDPGKYAPLYGWSQWGLGFEFGYVLTPWTDLIVSTGYSQYLQKGSTGYNNYHYSNDSKSWTLQAGVGTHATEKITYRALMGVSQFEYGGKGNVDSGWSYSLSGNWRVSRQMQLTVLGNSYYQPSERSLGQAIKVYSLSAGLSYLTLGDKMTLSANVAYRIEQAIYSDALLASKNDFDEDILSARLGASYTINRWVSIYGDLEWQECWCSGDYSDYNYDRYRGTIGLRFHY